MSPSRGRSEGERLGSGYTGCPASFCCRRREGKELPPLRVHETMLVLVLPLRGAPLEAGLAALRWCLANLEGGNHSRCISVMVLAVNPFSMIRATHVVREHEVQCDAEMQH